MYKREGIIYRTYSLFHKKARNMLWKSQRRALKYIGPDSAVFELPYISGYQYIEIGTNFYCGKDVRLEAWDKYGNQEFTPSIVVGNNVTFTDRCYLSCINQIIIGDGVLFGRDVFIADNSHGDSSEPMLAIAPKKRPLTSKGPVKIGNNVWIGRNVTILSGVTIGDNAIIGANSLVNKDIPENCVAAGNPAKPIQYRKS